MKLTKKYHVICLFVMALLTVSCNNDDDSDEYGNWVESSTFDGDSRGNAVSFTIGDKGYLITGHDGDDYLNDTWEYNSEFDYWVKRADFPGNARSGAVGFALNGKGYIGTGYDGFDELNDFWEYDPDTNQWAQKADFIGSPRFGAIGFSVNGYGYIGTGDDGSEQKDFYKYDATTDTWEQLVGFGGEKRKDAAVFVINDVAYIGTGTNDGAVEYDFYSFDGTTWTKLTDLDDDDLDEDIVFYSSAGFALNGKGYLATGLQGAVSNECWEYDPSTDSWDEMPNFEGSSRQDASAFSFDSKAYVLMGRSGNYYFDDVWEFRPDELENEDD
ncbi:galactose oxidase [Tamlana sedimentorum]|uniref:Galactose oxidase n=1 Tax=Neotamlana sedimentorum TaxID=1435349 RepID=A0A0D7WDF0_9FLAO|nr:kelch repeat-containing protein [Tamlana sedimentorum]KJD35752.1 galactose oxidase [Tamlana sedimentorum]